MSEDSIFGIRGIGIYQENEAPVIPSEAAIVRQERRERQARRCKCCGASELDGANFTTAPSSGICDDCL